MLIAPPACTQELHLHILQQADFSKQWIILSTTSLILAAPGFDPFSTCTSGKS
uniref:Uncharacterized protein n=1 Tax=Arundo donax TaxID=35708 RepID=A0A0A9GMK3_ARUDO